MTPEHWQKVTNLFEAALEREPSDRSAFLDEACHGDEELRAEVESLLSEHERAGSFIASPALGSKNLLMAVGTRLGPYEIVSPLGAGGMGEVYKAKDTRPGRTIAIKILSSHMSGNPDLRARFEREAKAIAQLQHPNICVLHDVGRENGVDFLVMEYLEGKSLATRLARKPLAADEALRIGIEVADALDKAHRSGIVHRDLKPGNVMLTIVTDN